MIRMALSMPWGGEKGRSATNQILADICTSPMS
jgi:hypothetical protein